MTSSVSTEWPAISFRPRRIGHFNLYVSDLETSHHFYRDICGLNLVFDEPGIEAKFYSNGNSHHDLALMQASTREHRGRDGHTQIAANRGTEPGLNHLGFEMASEAELVEALRRGLDAGYSVDRTVNHQISRSAYVRDADSLGLEFYTDAEEHYSVIYERVFGQLLTELWDPFVRPSSGQENFVHDPVPTSVASAPLHPSRAAHAGLVVSDLNRSLAFYSTVGGFEVLHGGPATGAALLGGQLGEPDLLLIDGKGRDPGIHHIAFALSVGIDVDAATRELEAADVTVVNVFDTPTKQGVAVADPDGLIVEFMCPQRDRDHIHEWLLCVGAEYLT